MEQKREGIRAAQKGFRSLSKGAIRLVKALLAIGMVYGLWSLIQIPRSDFWEICSWFVGLFFGMLAFFFLSDESPSWKQVFWTGVLLRLVVFTAAPSWSEDYARFLWDGELLRINENPYAETPRQWLEIHQGEHDFLNQLFPRLNSPDYYSVYPPVNQAIFWIGAADSSGEIGKGIFALRLVLFLGEIGVFVLLLGLLRHFKKPLKWAIFYWLNPLIFIEIVGNVHFEGLVLLLLLASINAQKKSNIARSGGFFGLAVGMKVLPLILLPSWISYSEMRFSRKFWIGFVLAMLFGFGWLVFGNSWKHFLESIRLYQGKFEFNGSVYYLLREIGFWIKGYNTIAVLTKILSGVTVLSIGWICWKKRPQRLPELIDLWILIYLIYLIFQPVVHPWYLLPGIGLSVLSGRRAFLIWSFGAIFSYQAYNHPEVSENPIFLLLEYGLLGLGIYLDYFRAQTKASLAS